MTTIHTGFASSSHRPSLLPFKRRCYVANGWDRMRVWDGIESSDQEAGITGPSTEPGDWTNGGITEPSAGNVTAGTHKFRFRYMNSKTGYVSNPSNEIEFTAAGSKDMQFPIGSGGVTEIPPSSDAKVDTIVLEATQINQGTWYRAATALNTASSITCDLSDTQLAEQILVWPEFGHNVPPYAQHLVSFKDRIFAFGQVDHADGSVSVTNGSATVNGTGTNWTDAAEGRFLQIDGDDTVYEIDAVVSETEITLKANYGGATAASKGYTIFSRDNNVYFSHPQYPESWPSTNFFEGLGEERVRAIIGYGNGLLIFGLKSMDRFTYSVDPETDGFKRPIAGQRGALNQRVVVTVENAVYSMDRTGWFVYKGGIPQHISRQVDKRAQDDLDFDFADEFHGVFYPQLRTIRWFCVANGDTEAKVYFEYDIDRDTWSYGELDVALTHSDLVPRGNGLDVLLGDGNGHLWWDDAGTTMGGDADVANATVDSGATTTVVPVAGGGLPTSGIGMKGVTVYLPALGETRVVASNTDDTVTVDSAFSSAPSQGDTAQFGRIVAKLKSKAFFAGAFPQRLRGAYLWVWFEPTTASRELLVRFYRDRAASAHSEWPAAAYAAPKLLLEGVTPPADGATDWTIDTSHAGGVSRIPIGFGDTRTVEVEFEARQPDTPFRLYAYALSGIPKPTLV